jgi:DNA-binding NarL/FixJ family response regulator
VFLKVGPVPKRILIVDDSATIRQIIRTFFEKQSGIEICGEAVDGLDAIEKAEELKPDLIVLDLAMPNLNGVETASILKRRMPKTPIILFTMYDELASQSLIASVGVTAVISKPDGVRKLVESARNLLSA